METKIYYRDVSLVSSQCVVLSFLHLIILWCFLDYPEMGFSIGLHYPTMGEDRTPLPMDDGKIEVEKERARRRKE